jgi:hypothetical protein
MVVLDKPPEKPKPHNCEPPLDQSAIEKVESGELWTPPVWLSDGRIWYAAEPDGSVWRCDECWELWMAVGTIWTRYFNLSPKQKRKCRKMDRKNPIWFRPRLNSAAQRKVVRHRDGTTSGRDSPYILNWKRSKLMRQSQMRKPPTGPSGQSKRSK